MGLAVGGVPSVKGEFPGMPVRQILEPVFQVFFARSEQDELKIVGRQQFLQRRRIYIQSLLPGKTGNDAEERSIVPHRQSELFLQFRTADILAGDIFHGVRRRQKRVLRRIPHRRVDPVQDPAEPSLARPASQRRFQPEAVFRGEDLPGIGRTDRVDHVGGHDPALEEIQAVIIFQTGVVEVLPAQSGTRQLLFRKDPLIADIVNGQHGAAVPERFPPGIQAALQIDAAQCRVPVVGMENIGIQSQPVRGFHGGPGEEDEAFGIVAVFSSAPVVEPRTVEVFVEFQEIDGQIFLHLEYADRRPFHPSARGNAEKFQLPGELQVQFACLLGIPRHEYGNVVSAGGEGIRQCA